MWFMVCRWPQSQEGHWARPHLCKLARHGPWPAQKRFIRDHVWWRKSKPGCQIVRSVTTVWMTTEANNQWEPITHSFSHNCLLFHGQYELDQFTRKKLLRFFHRLGALPTCIYTVSQKKTRHQTLAHNFPTSQPIFKILSLFDSLVDLQLTHI